MKYRQNTVQQLPTIRMSTLKVAGDWYLLGEENDDFSMTFSVNYISSKQCRCNLGKKNIYIYLDFKCHSIKQQNSDHWHVTSYFCFQKGGNQTVDSFPTASCSISNPNDRAGGTHIITLGVLWGITCHILAVCDWLGLPAGERKMHLLSFVFFFVIFFFFKHMWLHR